MKQIPDEIKAGMALLDEKAPGWRGEVDPKTLNMAYCFSCVLGQVFGEYTEGLRRLGIITDDDEAEEAFTQAEELGFQSKVRNGIALDYEYLNRAWKEALSESSSPIAAE